MDKMDLKNVEWTGVVTSFYSQYCFENNIKRITEDSYRTQIVDYFRTYFGMVNSNPHNLMTMNRIPFQGILNVAYRNNVFDQTLQSYIDQKPDCDVVNIGCGFDTRYFRLKNFKGQYLDVDLESVISVKKSLLPENNQYHMIACKDAFSGEFINGKLPRRLTNPIFLCEGVFCYIPYQKLACFLAKLFADYPEAILICDVFLYQEHLVFTDIHSKILLKYPEDGAERYRRFRRCYELLEKIRVTLSKNKDVFSAKLKDTVSLEEVYELGTDSTAYAVEFHNQHYVPEYWVGVYGKRKE